MFPDARIRYRWRAGSNGHRTSSSGSPFSAYAGKFVPRGDRSPGGEGGQRAVACGPPGPPRPDLHGAMGRTRAWTAFRWRACSERGSTSTTCSIARKMRQSIAYIIIDRLHRRATVLWRHDDCLRIDPDGSAHEHIDVRTSRAIDWIPMTARARRHARRRCAEGQWNPGDSHVDPSITASTARVVVPRTSIMVDSSEVSGRMDWQNDPLQALRRTSPERIRALNGGSHDVGVTAALARQTKVRILARIRGNCVDYTDVGTCLRGRYLAVLQGMPMRAPSISRTPWRLD